MGFHGRVGGIGRRPFILAPSLLAHRILPGCWHMTNYQFRWPKELDDRLRELWPVSSLAEMSREFGLSTRRIKDRAKRLKLPIATYRERLTPSKAEWVEIASQIAREAKLRPSDVLAGCRYKKAVWARWRAWRAILEANPHYSVAGVARTSGHDHTTVLHGLQRLAGKNPRWETAGGSRALGRTHHSPVDNLQP